MKNLDESIEEKIVELSQRYKIAYWKTDFLYKRMIDKQYKRELLTKENYKNGIKERVEKTALGILERYLRRTYKKRD